MTGKHISRSHPPDVDHRPFKRLWGFPRITEVLGFPVVIVCGTIKEIETAHNGRTRVEKSVSIYIIMIAFAAGFLLWTAVHAVPTKSSPTVAVRNGTYTGVRSSTYNQDFFLGMPYAQQPVGNLRFTVPQSLNASWDDTRDATQYSDICVGYGVSTILLVMFQDDSYQCVN